MRRILSTETNQKLDSLASELLAIHHWDMRYRQHRHPELDQKIAFVSRQKRRSVIIAQMLTALRQDMKT